MAASSESGSLTEDNFREKESTNWILQLPDELVNKILSGLTLKEAVRTSVLSKRWINLWKSADLVLDFDYTNELKVIDTRSEDVELAKLQRQFKNWVNEVLNQHNASRIIKFRIAFMFTGERNSKIDIGRWIKFAISKRVEFLDLALTSRWKYVHLQDCYNNIKTPAGLSEIKSLRSLRLSFVDIREKVLERVIANCPLLEELSLNRLKRIRKLRVVGSSHSPLPLKHLEVRMCWNVRFVEIDHAPNLVRLICDNYGYPLEELMVSSNSSRLVDLTLSVYDFDVTRRFVSRWASQVRFLFLDIPFMTYPLSGMNELTCLERLTIEAIGYYKKGIIGLIPLINQCSRLHTLQVNFQTLYKGVVQVDVDKSERESIKSVEFVGFRGGFSEREFVKYVMQYFVGLERIKIVINHVPWTMKHPDVAKESALEFKSKASPAVEFVLI
ncbi:F-box protein At5g03100 [Linum perenne]